MTTAMRSMSVRCVPDVKAADMQMAEASERAREG